MPSTGSDTDNDANRWRGSSYRGRQRPAATSPRRAGPAIPAINLRRRWTSPTAPFRQTYWPAATKSRSSWISGLPGAAPARRSDPCSSGPWPPPMVPLSWPKSTWTTTRASPSRSACNRSRPSSPSTEGKVVDQFIGALPEPQVIAFVQKLLPALSEADTLVANGDEASLRQALELEPGHQGATEALARDPDRSGRGRRRAGPAGPRSRDAEGSHAGRPGPSDRERRERLGHRRRRGRSAAECAARPGARGRRGPPGVRRPARDPRARTIRARGRSAGRWPRASTDGPRDAVSAPHR